MICRDSAQFQKAFDLALGLQNDARALFLSIPTVPANAITFESEPGFCAEHADGLRQRQLAFQNRYDHAWSKSLAAARIAVIEGYGLDIFEASIRLFLNTEKTARTFAVLNATCVLGGDSGRAIVLLCVLQSGEQFSISLGIDKIFAG